MRRLVVVASIGAMSLFSSLTCAISLPTLVDLAATYDTSEGSYDVQVTMERENILAGFVFDGYDRDYELMIYDAATDFEFETDFASEIARENWVQLL